MITTITTIPNFKTFDDCKRFKETCTKEQGQRLRIAGSWILKAKTGIYDTVKMFPANAEKQKEFINAVIYYILVFNLHHKVEVNNLKIKIIC